MCVCVCVYIYINNKGLVSRKTTLKIRKMTILRRMGKTYKKFSKINMNEKHISTLLLIREYKFKPE